MSGSIALIYDGYQCWLLREEDPSDPILEPAPQMHNIRMSPYFEEFRQEDQYPYPVISRMFCLKIPVVNTLNLIMISLDGNVSDELRRQSAAYTARILAGPLAERVLIEVRRILLDQALPQRLDFRPDIIRFMPRQLIQIIQQTHHKHRGSYLL